MRIVKCLLEISAVVYEVCADEIGNCLVVIGKRILRRSGDRHLNRSGDKGGNRCIVLICRTEVAERQVFDGLVEEREFGNVLLIFGCKGNNGEVAAADEVIYIAVNILKERCNEVKRCLRTLACRGDRKAGAAGEADKAAAVLRGDLDGGNDVFKAFPRAVLGQELGRLPCPVLIGGQFACLVVIGGSIAGVRVENLRFRHAETVCVDVMIQCKTVV